MHTPNKHTTATGMDLSLVYDLLEGCSKYLCFSYPVTCHKCMAVGHISFQCSFTLEESLVFSTRIKVLEYLVYKGVRDLLLKEPIISESSDSMLQITLAM
jgi:hypothetical protein